MSEDVRLIKKYPNRRLYDTITSSYITVDDVKKLVLEQVPLKVVDAKTNEDLTRSVLLQIIQQRETAGQPIFSTNVLSHIIRFYGDAMQGMMASYLERNLNIFVEIQRRLQKQSLGAAAAGSQLNTEAWERLVQMQGPAIQQLMTSYLDQSAQVFVQIQQQLAKQARDLTSLMPFTTMMDLYGPQQKADGTDIASDPAGNAGDTDKS